MDNEREASDLIRSIERDRLRALVAADMETAHRLHADDFQLINPAGIAFSKGQYLGDIASGIVNYLLWEPGQMDVRLQGQMAAIRYQAQLEIIVHGEHAPLHYYWHTDVYEKRNGFWQVVWSQATHIR